MTKPALANTVFNSGKMFSKLGQLGEMNPMRHSTVETQLCLLMQYLTFYVLTDICNCVRFSSVSTIIKTDSVWFTTKGQVVIPAWLRKQFDIQDGTKAVVQATPEGILLKPVTRWAIER